MVVYIDDILVYSMSKEEHEVHFGLMYSLDALGKNKLYAKVKKCAFWLFEVALWGQVINEYGIMVRYFLL